MKHKVLEIYRKDADILVHIILENGDEIVTTLTHPFYVDGSGWIPAGSLDTSDRLLAEDGTDIRIKDIWVENLEETITVYNFQVEDYHTYYVGDTQILVHNTCSAGNVAGTIGDQGGNSSVKRPSWRQSELDVAKDFPEYLEQKSFIDGKEVPYGTKGSVRPDLYKEGFSIDVKTIILKLPLVEAI